MSRIPYDRDPDFTKPLLEIPAEARQRMRSRLAFLYGDDLAEKSMPELERTLKVHHTHKPTEMVEAEKGYEPTERFTERDMVLITYGDSIAGDHGATLQALHQFVETYNRGPSTRSICCLSFRTRRTGGFRSSNSRPSIRPWAPGNAFERWVPTTI